MSEFKQTEYTLSFTRPDQLGTVLSIGEDRYDLHPLEGRLTDSFLDELIKLNKNRQFPQTFYLRDNNVNNNPINISFPDEKQTVIEYDGEIKTYPVFFDMFYEKFRNNVKKYAIYFAAPCNYPAMFHLSFDEFVKKMERYRDGEREILNKLA